MAIATDLAQIGATPKVGICDLRHMDIVRGAGHDACYVARVAPVGMGMSFAPCEGGISHNEIENARPEDLAAGADVLLQALLDVAKVRGPSVGNT